jgi:hypothetical protein
MLSEWIIYWLNHELWETALSGQNKKINNSGQTNNYDQYPVHHLIEETKLLWHDAWRPEL